MKKICLLFLGLALVACSSKEDHEMEKAFQEDVFRISVKSSENAEHRYLLMESFPIEGGPVITKNPEHASLSEIEYAEAGIYYVYQPEAGFTGTDEVEITNNISNGAEIVSQTILKLIIEISE